MKILDELKDLKEQVKTEAALLNTAKEELQKVSDLINVCRSRKEVLLLEELSEDLIKKLQRLTDDNVIVLFCRDGTRIEIKRDTVSYRRKGQVR